MSDFAIELVQLENGEISLRRSDAPDEPLLTITFSEQVREFLQEDEMEVARLMAESGMDSYRNIQLQRVQEVKKAVNNGVLH